MPDGSSEKKKKKQWRAKEFLSSTGPLALRYVCYDHDFPMHIGGAHRLAWPGRHDGLL